MLNAVTNWVYFAQKKCFFEPSAFVKTSTFAE
jgi:hypothetical protein